MGIQYNDDGKPKHRRKKSKSKNPRRDCEKKKIVKRIEHNVNASQLFYELDSDDKPIVKQKQLKNILGHLVNYKTCLFLLA